MVRAVRPLRSLSTARGCARIDSRPDTAKIGSADHVEVHRARLLAVIGVRKTFPHGLGQKRRSAGQRIASGLPSTSDMPLHGVKRRDGQCADSCDTANSIVSLHHPVSARQ